VAVVEVKNLSWDAMSQARLVRTCQRIGEQVGKYIDAELEKGHDVSTGVVFRQRPTTPGRMEQIEALLEQEGLPVAWEDETIPERRQRGEASQPVPEPLDAKPVAHSPTVASLSYPASVQRALADATNPSPATGIPPASAAPSHRRGPQR